MKRLLEYPEVYNFYQRFIGADKYLKRFSDTFLNNKEYKNILDIGCGTSNVLNFYLSNKNAENTNYLGIDCSQKYINYCKKKYPKFQFINQSVCRKTDIDTVFDLVISMGVMAALSDENLKKMFSVIYSKSNKNTKIILADMNYRTDVKGLEKFLYKNERNSFLRNEQDYRNIISQFFNIDNVHYWDKVYHIPYSKIIFECSIKD